MKKLLLLLLLTILISLLACRKTPLEEPRYLSITSAIQTFYLNPQDTIGSGYTTYYFDTAQVNAERRTCFKLVVDPLNPDTNNNKYYVRIKSSY